MNNTLELIPEIGVPFPSKYSYQDLRKRVEAACNSANYLEAEGAEYSDRLTRSDKEQAAHMAARYAEDETAASKEYDNNTLSRMSTEATRYAVAILDEYGHRAASNASQIRNMVTTKLIHETDNADPKVRLRALELLGKISDVGLFSEKTEITVTHQTSDELKAKLKHKLERLINPPVPKNKVSLEELRQDEELQKINEIAVEGEYEEIPDETEDGE